MAQLERQMMIEQPTCRSLSCSNWIFRIFSAVSGSAFWRRLGGIWSGDLRATFSLRSSSNRSSPWTRESLKWEISIRCCSFLQLLLNAFFKTSDWWGFKRQRIISSKLISASINWCLKVKTSKDFIWRLFHWNLTLEHSMFFSWIFDNTNIFWSWRSNNEKIPTVENS